MALIETHDTGTSVNIPKGTGKFIAIVIIVSLMIWAAIILTPRLAESLNLYLEGLSTRAATNYAATQLDKVFGLESGEAVYTFELLGKEEALARAEKTDIVAVLQLSKLIDENPDKFTEVYFFHFKSSKDPREALGDGNILLVAKGSNDRWQMAW